MNDEHPLIKMGKICDRVFGRLDGRADLFMMEDEILQCKNLGLWATYGPVVVKRQPDLTHKRSWKCKVDGYTIGVVVYHAGTRLDPPEWEDVEIGQYENVYDAIRALADAFISRSAQWDHRGYSDGRTGG